MVVDWEYVEEVVVMFGKTKLPGYGVHNQAPPNMYGIHDQAH